MSSFFSSILSKVSTSSPSSSDDGDGLPSATTTTTTAPRASSTSSSSLLSLSPKTFLSNVVATALQEFFIIENPQQQIQLLSNNNQILLTNLQLKPQTILENDGNVLQSSGIVEQVEFSWVWGGNEQTSLIREIVLLVKGVNVRVCKIISEEETTSAAPPTSTTPPTSSSKAKDTKAAEGYLQRYAQQIIDHLTLKIEDLEVALEVENTNGSQTKSELVVGLQSLSLLSLGRQQSEAGEVEAEVLSQRISVDRFAIDILDDKMNRRPLLEPFGYAADITRKSGKRFQDGFLTGLEIRGQVFYDSSVSMDKLDNAGIAKEESFSSAVSTEAVDDTNNTASDGRWVLRLGKKQAKVVSECIGMLAAFQNGQGIHQSVDSEQSASEDLVSEDPTNKSDGTQASIESTLVFLPLPALSFVFDNDDDGIKDKASSRIDLPDCLFSCRLDMSLCQVQGSGTVMINDDCPLLQLPNGAEWILDGVAKSMVVRQSFNEETASDPNAVVAHLNLEEAPLRKLLTSVLDVAAVLQDATTSLNKEELWKEAEQVVTEEWRTWQEQNQSAVFSFALEGMATMRMSSSRVDGQQQDWVDACLRSFSVSVKSDGSIQSLRTGRFKAGPASFGEAVLVIPPGTFDTGNNTDPAFRFDDGITATLESKSVAEDLKTFFFNFASIVSPLEANSLPSNGESTDVVSIRLPFPVHIPSVEAEMESPASTVSLETLTVSPVGNIAIPSVVVDASELGSAKLQDLSIDVNEQTISIRSISSCDCPGFFQFGDPLLNTRLVLDAAGLHIKLDYLHLLPEYDPNKVSPKQPKKEDPSEISLPWPVHVELDRLYVPPSKLFPSALRAKSVGFSVRNGSENSIHFSLQKELMMQLDRSGNYLRMAAASFDADICTADMAVTSFQGTNLRLLSSSFGETKANVPAVSFENNKMTVSQEVTIEMPSQQVAEQLVEFVKDIATCSTAPSEIEGSGYMPEIPFPLDVVGVTATIAQPTATVATFREVSVLGTNAAIGNLEFGDNTGMKLSGEGLQVSIGSALEGSLQQLGELRIPPVVASKDVANITFAFQDSALTVQLGTIALELPDTMRHESSVASSNQIPFPIHFRAEAAKIKVGQTGFDITTGNINLSATPLDNTLQLEYAGQLSVKAVHQNGMETLEMAAGTPTGDPIKLAIDVATMRMTSLQCTSLQVGCTSYGRMIASAPSARYERTANTIVVEGEMNAYLENATGAMRLKETFQPLVDYFIDKESKEAGYAIQVPTALLLTESPSQARFSMDNVQYDGANIVHVERVHVHEKSNGASASISGIAATISPIAARVALVEALNVPSIMCLKEPIQNIQIWCTNDASGEIDELTFVIPDVNLMLQPKPGCERPPEVTVQETVMLPCHLKCSIENISLYDARYPSMAPTVLNKVLGFTQMPEKDPFHPLQDVPNKILLNGSFEKMQNDMLLLNNGTFQAETKTFSGQEFQKLRFQAKDGMASAGFSSIDWDSVFLGSANGSANEVIRLPFCFIDALELGLKYEGAILGTETRILIPRFVGTATTTSDDVVQHFKNAILRRAPAFLAKANVLGANLGDTAASTAGMVALAGSSALSTTGAGVAGIVAYDGMVAAIKSGKTSRGVSEHDKYQFGDITRGSVRALGSVCEGGTGVVTSSAKEYATNNSSRLGGAAGSTVGMIAGAALLGPVGLIAGGVAGARAGARAFKNSQSSQASDQTEKDDSMPEESPVGPVDLLDDGLTVGAAPASTAPPVAAFAPPAMQGMSANQGQQNINASRQQQQVQNLAQQSQTMPYPHHQMPPQHQQRQSTTNPPQPYQQQQSPYTHSRQTPQYQSHPHQYQQYQQRSQQHIPQRSHQQPQRQHPPQQQGYRFGDLSRSIIAKGKAKDGRSQQDGYKFGDFTRGLFK